MTAASTCAIQKESHNPSFYRGEQYDSDLGLYYLRARYYNPATGRFLSRDPEAGYINIPRSLHKYLYTGGDPVNRIDPQGRADDAGEEAELDEGALTHDVAYMAKELGFTQKIIRAAIETLKQANTFAGNPDVWVDVTNGNVYLETALEGSEKWELLDNLLDYLPY